MILRLYIASLKSLKNAGRLDRLAIEITLILIIKVLAIWLLWYLCFSHPPVQKADRQQAVTHIILNNSPP
jgi:hypothetical protein